MPGLGLSIGIFTPRGPFVGGGSGLPSNGLLLESGGSSFLLLEEGSFLLLE